MEVPRVALLWPISELHLDRQQATAVFDNPIDLGPVGIPPEPYTRSREVKTAQSDDLKSYELLEQLAHARR